MSAPNASPSAPQALPFFALNGSYLISPANTLEQLVQDASCLGEAAEGAAGMLATTAGDDGSPHAPSAYAVLYLIRQCNALIDELSRRIESGVQ